MMYRWIAALGFLASCNIYNSHFDCPPGEGIGCAPVGEVLDLIVEREDGEDLFVEDKGTALLLKQNDREVFSRPRIRSKKFLLIQDEQGQFMLVRSPEEHTK